MARPASLSGQAPRTGGCSSGTCSSGTIPTPWHSHRVMASAHCGLGGRFARCRRVRRRIQSANAASACCLT
eukprot:12937622-Prorocentrum_lima.AAC.1